MSSAGFKYFAIFGAMRTGSNLLERNLGQYDGITCHGELFNPAFIGKAGQEEHLGIDLAAREADPAKLISKMVNQSGDALPGFRIFQGHDPRVFEASLKDPKCAKIILRRRPLDSFVSLKIALATDQWILGNAPKRRAQTVHYDGGEYRAYLADLAEYETALRRGIQEAGQSAFELQFDDLKSADVMNGLVAYLERGSGVRDIIVGRKTALLYAPIPGVNSRPALGMMGHFDGSDPGLLKTGMNQKELGTWLESAPDHVSFTVVDHPIARAYEIFMSHIFPPEGARFPKIRRRLKKHFNVRFPDTLDGWSLEDHAASFEAYLVFLKSNLAGQTSIRIDPNWEAQHKLVASVSQVQPIGRIIRSQDFEDFAQGVAASLESPAPQFGEAIEATEYRLEDIAFRWSAPASSGASKVNTRSTG